MPREMFSYTPKPRITSAAVETVLIHVPAHHHPHAPCSRTVPGVSVCITPVSSYRCLSVPGLCTPWVSTLLLQCPVIRRLLGGETRWYSVRFWYVVRPRQF